jgi:hypothetical protein
MTYYDCYGYNFYYGGYGYYEYSVHPKEGTSAATNFLMATIFICMFCGVNYYNCFVHKNHHEE